MSQRPAFVFRFRIVTYERPTSAFFIWHRRIHSLCITISVTGNRFPGQIQKATSSQPREIQSLNNWSCDKGAWGSPEASDGRRRQNRTAPPSSLSTSARTRPTTPAARTRRWWRAGPRRSSWTRRWSSCTTRTRPPSRPRRRTCGGACLSCLPTPWPRRCLRAIEKGGKWDEPISCNPSSSHRLWMVEWRYSLSNIRIPRHNFKLIQIIFPKMIISQALKQGSMLGSRQLQKKTWSESNWWAVATSTINVKTEEKIGEL